MDKKDFKIYFNHCGEDTMLVSYLSQYLRDRGFKTFDRSVDRVPVDGHEVLSEADALAEAMLMIDVLTEDSVVNASCQDMEARAVAAGKPAVVVRFADVEVPENMRPYPELKGDRAATDEVMARVYQLILKASGLSE